MNNVFEIAAPQRLEMEMVSKYPKLDAYITSLRQIDMSWPSWCYLPMSASEAIVSVGNGILTPGFHVHNFLRFQDFLKLSAVIPWRIDKHIYVFDDVLASCAMQKLWKEKNIKTEDLFQIPNQCVYVNNPPGVNGCAGLFFFLEYDLRFPTEVELRLHYLFQNGNMDAKHFVWSSDLDTLAERARREDEITRANISGNELPEDFAEGIVVSDETAEKHVGLLLYIIENQNAIITKKGTNNIKWCYVG